MTLDDLDYALPPELIAQDPAAERTAARLLVVPRDDAPLRHHTVADLPSLLRAGDLLVLNEARVVPARVAARRPSGGRLELLFVEPAGDGGEWTCMVRGQPRVGERVHLPEATGTWTAALGDGFWRARVDVADGVPSWLERVGEVPLPPYIRRPDGPLAADRTRYQTTFARVPGAVAAPTAGLHFTAGLLQRLHAAGIDHVALTLHVGPGTFLPVRGGDLATYAMAPERFELPAATAARIAAARVAGRRVVAVGTTSVRALEAAAALELFPGGGTAQASLFIRPGYEFRIVDALLTNFHLPRSPLLALVAALGGWPRVQAAYAEAVRERYRFYSYGDAMLLT